MSPRTVPKRALISGGSMSREYFMETERWIEMIL